MPTTIDIVPALELESGYFVRGKGWEKLLDALVEGCRGHNTLLILPFMAGIRCGWLTRGYVYDDSHRWELRYCYKKEKQVVQVNIFQNLKKIKPICFSITTV